LWRLADEPFGVGGVGGVEGSGAFVAHGLGGAVVDVGGGVQAEPGMAMLVVVLMRVILSRRLVMRLLGQAG
jgi:hypothetical protein